MSERRAAGPGAEVQVALIDPSPTDVSVADLAPGINTEQYRDWPPDRERIGICCSGGGIRSASFSLGALQIFRERGLLQEADYISAVSGGAYMAIAHAALVGLTIQDQADSPNPTGEDPFAQLPPWAPGSPEEKNLRDHSTYLAPGAGGKLWMLFNVVYGMGRQLLPLAAALYALGLFVGWLYEPWLKNALLDPKKGPSVEVSFYAPLWATVGLFGVMALVLGGRHLYQQRIAPSGAVLERLRVTTMNLFYLGLVWAVFSLGLPHLLLLLDEPPNLIDWIKSAPALLAIEVGGLTIISALGWLARKGVFSRLVPVVVPIVAPLIVSVPFVFAVRLGIERGGHGWPLFWWFLALLWLAIVWLALDFVTPSIHRFYRERLSTVFIGLRRRRGGRIEFVQPRWSKPVRFSEMQRSGNPKARFPRLVVCAAVNVSSDVPPGRQAASFTFERYRSGGPLTGYVKTKELEEVAGLSSLTLPAMMAISGAAVSPSMGKATRASYRLLFALFNVRLGVWLPNPRRLREVARIETGAKFESSIGRLGARIRRKAVRPGIGYLLNEALGMNNLKKNYVYVSDGGHWENLGVVELMRRGCMQIVCLDASGDDPGRYDTLGEAIALARSELGIEVEIDCSSLSPGDDGFSAASHAVGTIRYPNGNGGLNESEGILVLAKTVITKESPLDVRSYRDKDERFPHHSTGDQLFDDQQFESYRALGAHVGGRALDALNSIRRYNGMTPIAHE